MKCPRCGLTITKKMAASVMGRSRSEAKAEAARENGKKHKKHEHTLVPLRDSENKH